MGKNGNAHPYIPSAGMIVQTFTQLRKMFPAKVDAETLKKLSIAPKNESMVINVLRFLGFISDESNKTPVASSVFSKHDDTEFSSALEKVVKDAYKELFKICGDEAWKADRGTLIGFFRTHDETSALTATRQAIAFETLASLSGHGEAVQVKTQKSKTSVKSTESKMKPKTVTSEAKIDTTQSQLGHEHVGPGNLGLTVRIEINLPAQGDQETYDRIFQSIKKNLLNG
ncbi:MAG: DUF5343 domain-containing protein [Nitrospirota bacterium]|nr:DUF5343 domain-containing protein [Nitrospirota bacterium]MDP2383474.1 DUF5343 domain-containing protein [Nitrospirota bacterium]MDP3596849.1 DUF5343 domain-containing protein [Nitrospirota bacterium]